MATTTQNQVSEKPANGAAMAVAPPQAPAKMTVVDALKKTFAEWRPTLKEILPKHIDPDRVIKIAMNAYLNNPNLHTCSVQSMVKATLLCAEMGLEPSPQFGEAWFIPYNNKKKVKDGNVYKTVEVEEVSLQPGYKGLIKLARQTGDISDVYAVVVDECEADSFEVHEGTDRRIVHRKNMRDRTGTLFAVYGVVKFKDGTSHFEVMSKSEVDAIRKRSKSSDSGPWVTDYAAMAKKTAIKQALKTCPMSPEKPALPTAIAADNAAEMGEAFRTELTDAIDADGTPVIEPTVTRTDALAAKLGHDPVTGEIKS